jgi:DNA-binding MarR family transcriptional regulator
MAGVHTIDKMPERDRKRIVQALVDAGDEPDYRGLIRTLGLKCSHLSLWRYHRNKVKPALARNVDKLVSAELVSTQPDAKDLIPTGDRVIQRAQCETKQVLADDPIVAAAIAKRRRINQAIEKTFSNEQFETYAKLESVDIRALELQAKAMQHPGFSPAVVQASTTNIQIVVMPAAPAESPRSAQGPVIDVVEIKR